MSEVELENVIRAEIDFDEMSDAAEELVLNYYPKFLEIAIDYLENDKPDMYFQALLLDYIRDSDKSKAIRAIIGRNHSVQPYLLRYIMENMIPLFNLKDMKIISLTVKDIYLNLNESEKDSIKDVYSEFYKEFFQ